MVLNLLADATVVSARLLSGSWEVPHCNHVYGAIVAGTHLLPRDKPGKLNLGASQISCKHRISLSRAVGALAQIVKMTY